MIEKIKKNWKNILLVLFVLFSLNKCTQSCNRQNIIDSQNKEIQVKDSTISALSADTLEKRHTIDVLNEKINTEKANTAAADARSEVSKANEETANAVAQTERLRRQLNSKK